MTIRVLPDVVVGRIAAGEVITRPRAAVRELIDNALDAGATRIEIEIVAGGYDLIAVHDDGAGIAAADAGLLFTRHATSKLDGIDGLAAIRTLGFRGEALASMSAVADVEVRTRQVAETVGWRRTNNGEQSPLARRAGTSVSVTRLFSRYPVRRDGATPLAEARAIRKLVTHLALARPEVSWTMRVDGRLTVMTTGGGLRAVMDELDERSGSAPLIALGPIAAGEARIAGLISGPSMHLSSRAGIVLTVNGRLCDVPEIRRAIQIAYADILPRHRFPHAIVSIEIPPERVDANIHPAKERVGIHNVATVVGPLRAELRALLGRSSHLVSGYRSLAVDLGRLPGAGFAENSTPYKSGGWERREVAAGSLPGLRVVGQIADTLIICEAEIGTLLIDQHRAHERVIYEQLLAGETIEPIEPLRLTVPTRLRAGLEENGDNLRRAGWRWDEFGLDDILVTGSPAGLAPNALPEILALHAAEPAHDVLAAAACHAAIRKRRPLDPATAVALLGALTLTRTPTTCPHGQPIVINLDRDFLERQFGWR